jgi:hypothetical protein
MKKRQNGFTYIELILTMVLCAILAGVVVEIIAGPIRAYFWYTQRNLLVDMAQVSIESIQHDLNSSMPNLLIVNSQPEKQEIQFRQVLYKGVLLPDQLTNNKLSLAIELPENVANKEQPLFMTFVSNDEKNQKIYPLVVSHKDKGIEILLKEPLPAFSKPLPYFIVTAITKYECLQNKHTLERIAMVSDTGKQTSLISNQVTDCQFTLLNGQQKGVLVSFGFGQDKSHVKLTQPLFVGKSYVQ